MKKTTLTLAIAMATSQTHASDWQHKVSTKTLEQINQQTEVELILKLSSPAVTLKPAQFRIEKIKNKVAQLKQQATKSQRPVIEYLQKHNIKHQAFWVSNQILIKAKTEQVPTI